MSTFVNGSGTSFVGASGALTKPAGLAAGDVQLCNVTCDASSVPGISGGATWTQIGSTQSIISGDGQQSALFRQVAGASEPASYTVTNGGSNGTSAVLGAWRGVDNASPIAASLATNPDSGSPPASAVSMAANAITTTAANQTVAYIATIDWNSSSAAAFTDPASTTRRAVETPAQFSNGLMCSFVQAGQNSTGTITGTATLAAATGNYTAWLVALKNAPSGPSLMGTSIWMTA